MAIRQVDPRTWRGDNIGDRPAIATRRPGDRFFAPSLAYEARFDGGGALTWADLASSGTAPSSSVVPTGDNTLDLGSGAFAWRTLYLKTGIVADDAIGIDLATAGPSQLSIGNSTPGAGNVANVAVDGTFIFQNGASGANLFAFSGTPTGSRVITFPDESGTVPLLGRSGQTFTETTGFQNGLTTTEAAGYLGFTASGFTLQLKSSGVNANRVVTIPQPGADDTVCLLDHAQTLASKTLSRSKLASLTVAAIGALASPAAGEMAFASNGRKPGEGGGAGTGVVAFYDGSGWRSMCDGATLAA